jgi:acetyl esterase/lipase
MLVELPPVIAHMGDRKKYLGDTVDYHNGQRLDIWCHGFIEPAPVLIFIPGGAWVIGKRWPQGYALMSHMVRRGWICVSIDYRPAPWHRWPAQFEDVCAAIAWVHTHIAEYGGDPNCIALSGASAGGHLAALAGLTVPNIAAVVPLYGVYDWTLPGVRRMFVKCAVAQTLNPDVLIQASPIKWATDEAPPFLVVHGGSDHIVPASEGRRFSEVLDCPYLEAPGAGHAFDLTDAGTTRAVVGEVGDFLGEIDLLEHKPSMLTGLMRTVGF